jgi:hypothetical protein
VSVAFVSPDGGIAFGSTRLDLAENDAVLKRAGTIRGVVMEGNRRQAGLEVQLLDRKGNEVRRTRTSDSGAFGFQSVRPGKYRLLCVKPANGRQGAYPGKRGEFLDLRRNATARAEVRLNLR